MSVRTPSTDLSSEHDVKHTIRALPTTLMNSPIYEDGLSTAQCQFLLKSISRAAAFFATNAFDRAARAQYRLNVRFLPDDTCDYEFQISRSSSELSNQRR